MIEETPQSVFAAIRAPFGERILRRLTVSADECWRVAKPDPTTGYARIRRGAKLFYIHILAYILARGPYSPSLQIDHKCRVRNCVNPDHLEPVTQIVNILRGNGYSARNARKTHCPKGHDYAIYSRKRSRPGRDCLLCHREQERNRKARRNGNGIAVGPDPAESLVDAYHIELPKEF